MTVIYLAVIYLVH